MMEKARNFKLENVTLNWCRLNTPVNPFGTEQYEAQVVVSKEQAATLAKEHFNVKEKDGVFSISLKRKAKKADGSDNGKVRVVDSNLQPITDMIGNGSKGNVIVFQYPYTYAGRTGIGNSLTAIQVTDMIKFESDPAAEFNAIGSEEEPKVETKDLF